MHIKVFLYILTSSTVWTCIDICLTNFQDQYLEPVGCNETTMWTFTSRSKLSCALSCTLSNTCAVFQYSSDVNLCSICPGGLIVNLTFNTFKTFSWPHQYQEKYTGSSLYSFSRYVAFPKEITLGSVVCIYIFNLMFIYI